MPLLSPCRAQVSTPQWVHGKQQLQSHPQGMPNPKVPWTPLLTVTGVICSSLKSKHSMRRPRTHTLAFHGTPCHDASGISAHLGTRFPCHFETLRLSDGGPTETSPSSPELSQAKERAWLPGSEAAVEVLQRGNQFWPQVSGTGAKCCKVLCIDQAIRAQTPPPPGQASSSTSLSPG